MPVHSQTGLNFNYTGEIININDWHPYYRRPGAKNPDTQQCALRCHICYLTPLWIFAFLFRFGKISKKSVPRNTDMEGPFQDENMKQSEDMWETKVKEQKIEETVRILQDVVMRGGKYARFS